jgi:starch-binding outer membrane protein, SusD/RagB family
MKTSIRTTALATALVLLAGTACQKDFLTEVPQDFVAPQNFYSNANDATTAVNAVYSTFIDLQSPFSSSDYMGRNLWMMLEYPTEVVTSRLSATNERSLFGTYHPQFNSTHSYIDGIYQAAYAGINRANSVIGRVPAVPMDTVRRKQIVAEAKFLRALHYYYLAGMFGGVPLKLTETASIGTDNIPRNTAAETWKQIEQDCIDAAAVLPTSWTGGDYGRVTKGAALTLLAHAYMQSVSQTGDASAYQKGLDALRQVQGLGYILDPNYASLFDGSNEKSKEIIFSFQNVNVPGAGGTITQWFVPNPSEPLYTGGNQQNQFQAERPFYDSYNATDIRKAATWLTSYNKKDGRTVTWAWSTTAVGTTGKNITDPVNYGSTGPVPRKYLDLSGAPSGSESPDVIIFRYGDVQLLAAEAVNEVSGPTAEAYADVNSVRARAKVPNLTAGLSQAQFRDSVFLERRYELATEMYGLFDNRRNWNWSKSRIEANMALISTLNKSPFTSSVEKSDNRPIADKWKLYPIPAHACQFNNLLTQNPGWDDGICQPSTGTP